MAHAEGPCSRANAWANESFSALMMKLTSPWVCRVTFFDRCRATTGKPSRSNRMRNSCGSGAVYSTNSKPSVPIGFDSESFMCSPNQSQLPPLYRPKRGHLRPLMYNPAPVNEPAGTAFQPPGPQVALEGIFDHG